MRFMVIVRSTPATEAGELPSSELLEAMGRYNERLVEAGVLLGMEGLHPSAKGARVTFDGTTLTVTDGPFAETKELIAGYWIFRCASLAECIEWVKQAPNVGMGVLEIRQIFEAEDFGDAFTPELRAQEERVIAKAQAQA